MSFLFKCTLYFVEVVSRAENDLYWNLEVNASSVTLGLGEPFQGSNQNHLRLKLRVYV